jgi:hypothetical protein
MPPEWSRRSTDSSRITMKRHGCSLRLLPDQRATSTMASRTSSATGSAVNWRT